LRAVKRPFSVWGSAQLIFIGLGTILVATFFWIIIWQLLRTMPAIWFLVVNPPPQPAALHCPILWPETARSHQTPKTDWQP
jgi:fatty acid desaturase